MELIKSEEKTPPTPRQDSAEPRETAPVLPAKKESKGQAWLSSLITILGAVILVVLIVLFARWVYHKAHHNVTQTPISITSQSSKSAKQQAQNQKTPASNNSGSASSPSNGSSPSTKTPTPAPAANTKLPNSGPGEVAVIFISTSLAAAALHYIIRQRRLSS